MHESTRSTTVAPAARTNRAESGAETTGQTDPEVLAFRAQFEQARFEQAHVEDRSPLDTLVREGARRMLQQAIDAEVEQFLIRHADRRDEQGRRLIVRNGHLPAREILTGAGPLEVRQPRVRDRSPDSEQRVRFSPERAAALPAPQPLARRADSAAVPQGDLHRRFLRRAAGAVGPGRSGPQFQRRRAAEGAMVAGARGLL